MKYTPKVGDVIIHKKDQRFKYRILSVVDDVVTYHGYVYDTAASTANFENCFPEKEYIFPVERWEPEYVEMYFTPNLQQKDMYSLCFWDNHPLDELRLERGLVFKTKEEAIACAEKMLNAIK